MSQQQLSTQQLPYREMERLRQVSPGLRQVSPGLCQGGARNPLWVFLPENRDWELQPARRLGILGSFGCQVLLYQEMEQLRQVSPVLCQGGAGNPLWVFLA